MKVIEFVTCHEISCEFSQVFLMILHFIQFTKAVQMTSDRQGFPVWFSDSAELDHNTFKMLLWQVFSF